VLYAPKQIDQGIRMGDRTVMLSLVLSEANGAAKHLDAQRDRPFASLRLTVEEPISSSVVFLKLHQAMNSRRITS